MPKIPTREDLERIEYRSQEIFKVIKKYARQELAKIAERKLLTPYNEARKKYLNFILKSKEFPGIPMSAFPDEVIREIERLPFMDDKLSAEKPEERVFYKEISRLQSLPKERGKKKKGVETRLPGLVAAIKKFKDKPTKTSIGDFYKFISKKEYTQKTPYQIDCYDLYVDDGYIYHLDRTKNSKNGKNNLKWDSPLKISSLDRYYYVYVK